MFGEKKQLAIPQMPAVQRVLENKFYFDALYDAVFYKPAAALANGLRAEIEEPVIAPGQRATCGDLTLETGARRPARSRPALLRTYVLFIAARRGDPRPRLPHRRNACTAYLTSILIWLPIAGAIAVWLLPLSKYATGSLARARLAHRGRLLDRAGVARFDFHQHGLQMSEQAKWFGELGDLVPRRRLRLLGLARGPHRGRDGGVASATASGSAATGHARTSRSCSCSLGATVGVFEAQDLSSSTSSSS